MKCPYRNTAKESGCDLVDDLCGVRGVIAREFCDYRDCQECPLFQEALRENIEEWTKHPEESKSQGDVAHTKAGLQPQSRRWILEPRPGEARP